MTRTEEVDAAIERAKSEETSWVISKSRVQSDWDLLTRLADDRRLLAVEVVLLREAVRGLQAEKEDLLDQIRELV